MAEKYTLSAHITVSAYTVVEADSLEEAVAASKEREVDTDFGGGVRPDHNTSWVVSAIDGEPHNIRAED